MRLYIPKTFYRVPPLFIPLIFYMISTILFWGIINGTMPALYALLFFYLVALCIALCHKSNPYTIAFIIAALLLSGVRNYQTISYYRAFPFALTEQSATIQATFSNYSYNSKSRFAHCHTLAVHTVRTHTAEKQIAYTIQLYTRKKLEAAIDDTIELANLTLKRPKHDPFYLYLMKEGIAATAFQEHQSVTILSHSMFSVSRWLFERKQNMIQLFQCNLNKPTFGLFTALFLGEKTALKHDTHSLENSFKQWGIVHYLARSGLHLVIIISLCHFLLQCLPLGFIYKQLLLFFAILIYALLSWSSISFMRALVIFLMYTFCLITRRPYHMMHLLLACCFLFLIINPLYLLFLDFQLSFGLTFALAWLNLFKMVGPVGN